MIPPEPQIRKLMEFMSLGRIQAIHHLQQRETLRRRKSEYGTRNEK